MTYMKSCRKIVFFGILSTDSNLSFFLYILPDPLSSIISRYTLNAGQLSLGSSRPGSSRPGPIFKLVEKGVYSTKVGGRMSDTKKHNFMRRLFHFLYHTKDTQYQLMSVDIECPRQH